MLHKTNLWNQICFIAMLIMPKFNHFFSQLQCFLSLSAGYVIKVILTHHIPNYYCKFYHIQLTTEFEIQTWVGNTDRDGYSHMMQNPYYFCGHCEYEVSCLREGLSKQVSQCGRGKQSDAGSCAGRELGCRSSDAGGAE